MTAVNISKVAKLPVAVKRYCRNTKPVSAEFQNLLAEGAGYLGNVRGWKQVFTMSCDTGSIPTSQAATRSRWRAAFHTAPFTRYIRVYLLLAKQNSGTASDPYVKVSLLDAAGASTLGTTSKHYGSGTTAFDFTSEFGFGYTTIATSTALLEVDPDTEYTLLFEDVSYGRLIAASVCEVPHDADTDNGYPAIDAGDGTPILDSHRQLVADIGRKVHKTWAAQLWNFCSDTDDTAPTNTTGTYTNIIDGTSTSVSSSTPGATIDLRYRSTIRTASDGVPVKMRVFAEVSSNLTSGTVRLLDSNGATMLESAAIASTTAAWYEVNGYLPASLAKYDLHSGGQDTELDLIVYAVSIYELDYTATDIAASTDGATGLLRIRAFDATMA